jgi:hypothetical protein
MNQTTPIAVPANVQDESQGAIARVAALLGASKIPSADEYEAALNEALVERNALRQVVSELATWMGKLIVPHINGDTETLHARMDELVRERCEITGAVPPSKLN